MGSTSHQYKCMKRGYVYILASKRDGTIYTGVTSNLCHRILEHKEGRIDGFTKKYQVHRLVYFEEYESISEAILREKQIKTYKRKWKVELIEKENSEWCELYYEMCDDY